MHDCILHVITLVILVQLSFLSCQLFRSVSASQMPGHWKQTNWKPQLYDSVH